VDVIGTTAVVTLTAVDGSGTASDFCNVTVTESYGVGCSNMEGFSNMFTLIAAPTALTYTTNAIVATKGVTNVSSIPSNQGGVITNYTINPALPAGITINPNTGVISGTPIVLSTLTTYTITGSNFAGNTMDNFTLTVNDVAPSALTYTPNPVVATKGVTNVSSIPANEGGIIVNYTINPELPAGLFFNSVTGTITGTPTVLSTETVYTITGNNTGGSTTGTFTLTVNDVPPSNLAYSYNPINAAVNVSNISSTPTADGGPVVSYTVEPALPTGLTLDAVTGLISGISSEAVTNKNYTITATNTGGSTTCEVLITVYEGISAPNTITPNGDGINDTWIIPNVADFAGYELTIFNNLGATLYQSSNYNNDWDVKYKGNDLPAGTYYYVFIKGSTVHKGFITVLRAK
jgi:gliding motility-associated-like protein